MAAQRQVVERLHNGSRPEEIAQARANVAQAAADASNAHVQSDRMRTLSQRSKGEAISQTDVDNWRTTAEMADAKLVAQQKALDLLVLGPRKEEIAENEAKLQAQEVQYAYLCRQLADAQLKSPMDAVVRTRLMEPGEMASPQKAVFSLAIVDPKWIRAYVSETDLGKVHPGMKGTIAVDSFPDRRFEGWVGFISPIAEFTPKIVQTDELRSTLVYEVRVFSEKSVGRSAARHAGHGVFDSATEHEIEWHWRLICQGLRASDVDRTLPATPSGTQPFSNILILNGSTASRIIRLTRTKYGTATSCESRLRGAVPNPGTAFFVAVPVARNPPPWRSRMWAKRRSRPSACGKEVRPFRPYL